jgi:hypothetical protein
MIQLARSRLVRVGAIAIAALPFAFGAARALQTGSDFRYLVVAVASLASATAIVRLGARRGPSSGVWVLALVGATLVSSAVAFALGARSAPAVLVVALAFSACVTAGLALGLFARG